MTPTTYYLSQVLPVSLSIAVVSLMLGAAFGRLLWGHYPARALAAERQNENLRNEIRRLNG